MPRPAKIPWWLQLAARAVLDRTGMDLWAFDKLEQDYIILAALDAGHNEKRIEDFAGDAAWEILRKDKKKKRPR